MQYGYGRVSTNAQDMALQEDAFKRAGVQRVITEKWSSVGARPQLMTLLSKLQSGDCVTVYKLDRLGRSLQDLLSILDKIHRVGASFRSITEPVDTRTPAGKLMYSVLGAVAEFERSIIKERAVAGQVAAWRRGKRWGGQPPALTPMECHDVWRLRETGMFTVPLLADIFGCSPSTIDRALSRHRDPARWSSRRLPVLRHHLQAH